MKGVGIEKINKSVMDARVRTLFALETSFRDINEMSAGESVSAYGAATVLKIDALTLASKHLYLALSALEKAKTYEARQNEEKELRHGKE